MPRFRSTRPEDVAFMKEYHEKRGHPCVPYFDYWEASRKKESIRYRMVLSGLLKKSRRKRKEYDEPQTPMYIPVKAYVPTRDSEYTQESEESLSYHYELDPAVKHLIILAFVFGLIFILTNGLQAGWIQSFIQEITKGTQEAATGITNTVTTVGTTIGIQKPDINVSGLESDIHNLINSEREKNGLNSLQLDNKLSDIARAHSQDMAARNFFSHYNLDGQDPTARASAAGYSCYKNYGSYYTVGIAENIFKNWLYTSITYYSSVPSYNWQTQDEIASSVVSGWMGSPGHRQNILTSTYGKEGIGVAIASDNAVYITEDFC